MAADSQGNDIEAVGIPIGGMVAFAPYAEENVIADADMGAKPITLPTGFKLLGLVKSDGAPQHARESDDATEFWQKGYSMPGDGTRSIQVNLAENTDTVLQLTEGKVPDTNGVIYVDSSLPDARVILFLATKYKNGTEDRYNGVAQVTAIEPDQDERGSVKGTSVTLEWREDELFADADGKLHPFKFWHGTPTAATTGA
jgi:hypothetical protein